jgi:hypothetical protein
MGSHTCPGDRPPYADTCTARDGSASEVVYIANGYFEGRTDDHLV